MSNPEISRRTALKVAGATLGAAAFARAVAPLTQWTQDLSMDEFLQKHYQEMTPSEMEKVLRRIEAKTLKEYGARVQVEDVRPLPESSLAMHSTCRSASAAASARKPVTRRTITTAPPTTPTFGCWK